MFNFNPETKVYTWNDQTSDASFSFKLLGKPQYLPAHFEYDECLRYIAVDLDSKDRFDVFIMRLNPMEWDYSEPQW